MGFKADVNEITCKERNTKSLSDTFTTDKGISSQLRGMKKTTNSTETNKVRLLDEFL
jgi:hypothetical protein